MKIFPEKFPRGLLLTAVYLIGIIGIAASGGGSDGQSVTFPTPTLPANARTLTAANAIETAESAVEFMAVGASFPDNLKPASTTPSVFDSIDQIVEQFVHRTRAANKSSTAQKFDDVSSFFCVAGTATVIHDESETDDSGVITFTNCDLGGVLITGTMPYQMSWNNSTGDYSLRFGSDLVFDFGSGKVTFVMDLRGSGNDFMGDWTNDMDFSVSAVPGDGFLASTTQSWTGNSSVFEVYTGQLIITGAANTRLRVTVTAINTADVELDNGSGSFVLIGPIAITP